MNDDKPKRPAGLSRRKLLQGSAIFLARSASPASFTPILEAVAQGSDRQVEALAFAKFLNWGSLLEPFYAAEDIMLISEFAPP